jgi:hypothetical protein
MINLTVWTDQIKYIKLNLFWQDLLNGNGGVKNGGVKSALDS